ncbi:hypothetical protein Y032_0131g1621 [Ancylostoma ceylanicum]|uniref:Uncharacterized protein n=1 Tax=Ancylostoma ceylanicum TaxID=53326 RepID=A0A016T6T3_9BILA|nr:hypothetical protein Y032_0131g1621 [Ancylostoma ceylanicum]
MLPSRYKKKKSQEALLLKIAKTIYARQVTLAEPVVRIRSPIADLFTAPKRKTISAIFVGARGKSHFSAADLTVL